MLIKNENATVTSAQTRNSQSLELTEATNVYIIWYDRLKTDLSPFNKNPFKPMF